jgi:hypothetical protein
VLVGLALLTAILQAVAFPMSMWDSVVIYGLKAKILFLQQTFKTGAFLDPQVIHYSADYPLLLPYLESDLYRWLGHPDDRVVRLLFAAYWAAWLGVLYEGLAARIRREYAWGLVAFIATLPLFSGSIMGQAASGFADIPLALYWTAFLLAPSRLLPFLAVGCVFTKNEGIPLVLIGCVLRKEYRSAAWGLLLLLPWFWTRHQLPHNAAHYLRALSFAGGDNLQRLKLASRSLCQEWVQLRQWGLFWLLAIVGALWPVKKLPFPKESRKLLAAAGLQLAVYLYVYLTYPQNLALLVPVTMTRLLIHLVGPLTLAIGWRLSPD